jgi:hypothetical protein
VNTRVLIASDYNSKERAHFTSSYEFCQVIAECEDADLVAPSIYNSLEKYLGSILPPHDNLGVQRDFNRLVAGIRKRVGLKNAPTIVPVNLSKDYELFVYMAWSPQALVELPRIRNWRQRCSKAVVFIQELWASTIEQNREYLKLLDQFDHVFLLHPGSVAGTQKYTRTPCSFMPAGTDCLIRTPYPSTPERVIDFYSIGNRAEGLHKQLVNLAEKQQIFYLYDSLSSSDSRMKSWREHHLLVANNIKRSRYFIAFSPAAIATYKAGQTKSEQVVPNRLFEGAAGGTVMLGQAPECPEFYEHFDWPDAVIKISPNPDDIKEVLEELESQVARTERARHTNAIQSLRRHDWVYRWERMLEAVDLKPSPKAHKRKLQLHQLADTAEANLSGMTPPVYPPAALIRQTG